MVSGVQSSNLIQAARAEQAFRNAAKNSADMKVDFVSDGVEGIQVPSSTSSNSEITKNTTESQSVKQESGDKSEFKSNLLDFKKDLVNDFKNFISKSGNFNVNNEDIDDALRYGKSILVDQKA